MDLWYLQKRFLWRFWVKVELWDYASRSLPGVYRAMTRGKLIFERGQRGAYWYMMDKGYYTEAFYESAEAFRDQHVEEFI